jgi:hypothetical protein
VKRLLILVLLPLVLTAAGCTGSRPQPVSRRPPFKIEWQDPVSVMRGFLRAKKTGDWRTAYSACDYEETLPKEMRANIKKKWKEESKRWPLEYADTYWQITERRFDAETAVVRILVSRRNPITGELRPGEMYEETLKKYKDKWKITSPLVKSPD